MTVREIVAPAKWRRYEAAESDARKESRNRAYRSKGGVMYRRILDRAETPARQCGITMETPMVRLYIDEREISVPKGTSILDAACMADIYIPHLCSHPNLPPVRKMKAADAVYRGTEKIENKRPDLEYEGCRLCVVEVAGQEGFCKACTTEAKEGMVVRTTGPELVDYRQDRLMALVAKHPHACLTCAQKQGCARFPCSMDRLEVERCCPRFGKCEWQKICEYIELKPETPRYVFENLTNVKNDPLFDRNYNLCIGCTRCVRVCRDVRGVGAMDFVFDEGGRVIIGTTGPTIKDSGCRFCTACVEVCPTGALADKELWAGDRAEQLVPCKHACPAGIDIPEYLRCVAAGEYERALSVIRERVPFPHSLGHICFHPCESVCRRGEVNEAIAICSIKRFAAAEGRGKEGSGGNPPKMAPTGKKVAVAGGGPAGLTAAYFLSLLGHEVEVFDKDEEAGGMMRYAIPEYRLPRAVLNDDLAYIWNVGVKFIGGRRVCISELTDKYDAILISTGNPLSRKVNVKGAEMSGVLWGLDFLRAVRKGEGIRLKKKVCVIGGGNVAVDVALTAKRVCAGEGEVMMACLEKPEEMPAHRWEIDQAVEEGVKIHTSWGPRMVNGVNGEVKSIELMRCTSVFDENGRFSPRYNEDELKDIDADQVIFAVGQAPDATFIDVTDIRTERDMVQADSDLMTGMRGIFVCGEAHRSPGSVIDAVVGGRRAASSVDRYLGGDGYIHFELCEKKPPATNIGRREGFAHEKRAEMPVLGIAERNDFSLVELGYGEDTAKNEAARCLQCDLRLLIDEVTLPPREGMHPLVEERVNEVPGLEGVFILFNENKEAIFIKGAMNLKNDLKDQFEMEQRAKFFTYVADEMYTKRESEMLQHYMQEHGRQPMVHAEFDDLF